MARNFINRFSNPKNAPLSDDQIRKYAPAVFTDKHRPDYSDGYQVVNTAEILAGMRAEGFVPVEVQTYYRRKPSHVPFAMHLLRLQHKSVQTVKVVGATIPQIVLRNSHDGSSRFELYNGLFRMICANGMIVSDGEIVRPILVKHSARAVFEALAAVHELLARQQDVVKHLDHMSKFMLTDNQRTAFANEAIKLRSNVVGVISAEELLKPRRIDDAGNDMWHVFNRVQENLIRGGQQGLTANKRKTTVRGVSSLCADLNINAALWSLSMQVIGKAALSSKRAVEGNVVSVQDGTPRAAKGRTMATLLAAA